MTQRIPGWLFLIRGLSLLLIVGGVGLVLLGQVPTAAPPTPPPPGGPWVWIAAPDGAQAVQGLDPFPANLLASAGVRLFPGDRVRLNGRLVDPVAPQTWASGDVLQVERALRVRVYVSDGVRRLSSTAATLGEAAWQAGLRWRQGDRLEPASTTPLPWGSALHVTPGQWLVVHTATRDVRLWSSASTVGAALAQGALAPVGLDQTDPDPGDPLPPTGEVRLTRVWEEVVLEQRPIKYEVRYEPLPDVEIDHLQVIQEGALGLEVRRVRVRYADGEEVGREVEASWVARSPQDRIIGYGTKIVIHTLDTPDGPIRYWRAVQVYATSYHTCPPDAKNCSNVTASGRILHKGIVAVAQSWFPSMNGLPVYVPGYGMGVIGDTGLGIPGRRWIDLGYDYENYVPWHQWVTIYFLAPPPPPENILWILP